MLRRALASLSLVCVFGLARAADRPPRPADLTPPTRQLVDRAADQLPNEDPTPQPKELAGGLGGWLVSRVALSAEEEKDRAGKVDKKLGDGQRHKPTPEAVHKLLARLLKELPPALRPECFDFRVVVLDRKEPLIFTTGAGTIYITTGLLDPLLADRQRGPAMLSFLLAVEVGHVARLHTRRGYQLEMVLEETERETGLDIDSARLREALQTTPAPPDRLAPFLYTRHQQHEADLFALHLCRNAGIAPDDALDVLRWLAVVRFPPLLTDKDFKPDDRAPPPAWKEYLGTHPDSLRRLRRLRDDWLGRSDPEVYGLFRYDPATEKFRRCKEGEFKGTERPIVFVHGLHGGRHSFAEMLAFLSGRREMEGRPLLALFYPGDGSLSRAGQLLTNEIKRVVADPARTDFVCHSAGGLVFRFYAEKQGGAFDRAVLIATPHKGSNLTRLKFLADLRGFVRGLSQGLPETLTEMLSDGEGEIKHDLQPDSLFLRYLGHDAKRAGRYHIVHGRALGPTRAALLELSLDVAKTLLETHARKHNSKLLRRLVDRLVEQLTLPEEISDGDLIVSVRSASLEGAASTTATKHTHQSIKKSDDVMRLVAERLRTPRSGTCHQQQRRFPVRLHVATTWALRQPAFMKASASRTTVPLLLLALDSRVHPSHQRLHQAAFGLTTDKQGRTANPRPRNKELRQEALAMVCLPAQPAQRFADEVDKSSAIATITFVRGVAQLG